MDLVWRTDWPDRPDLPEAVAALLRGLERSAYRAKLGVDSQGCQSPHMYELVGVEIQDSLGVNPGVPNSIFDTVCTISTCQE